jgi:uncharacterized protein YjeT (DUF2065 family)
MTTVFLAIGLVLILEGLLYALFPDGVKRMMAFALEQPDQQLRNLGLVVASIGALIVYFFN